MSILGKKDMVVTYDTNYLNNRILEIIIQGFLLGNITEEHGKMYIKVLNQSNAQDTEKEAKIRQYLKRFYNERNIEVFEALTNWALQTPEK